VDDPELAGEQLHVDVKFQTPQESAVEVNNFPTSGSVEAPPPPRARYVKTADAEQMIKGREADVVRGVGIPWHGRDHIRCAYGTHPDHDPSWRLTEQGLAICTCRTAHSVFDVVMTMRGIDFDGAKLLVAEILGRDDLIVTPGESGGCTLVQLAEAKKLPIEFLREHDFFDLQKQGKYHNRAAVGISYKDRDGEKKWLRIRTELSGNSKRKFRWKTGDAGAPLYGAHMAAHLPAEGRAIIVEGETDALTCWFHSFPALGLPGAGTWNEDRHAPLLEGVPVVYVVVEPDQGGAATLRWVARSSIAPRVRLVRMTAKTKDPSALYLADRENFKTAFQALLAEAEPFDPQKHAPASTAASSGTALSYEDFWAYMPQHRYIFIPTGEDWPASSVDARLPARGSGRDSVSASEHLDKTRPIEQMTWAPGLPDIIRDRYVNEGGWIERPGANCFNRYRPPIVEPGDPAGAQPWLDQLYYIYPLDAEHLLDWFAHRVQKPEEKPNHALILGGTPGIGKDTILVPVAYAIGRWNFREISPDQAMDKDNDFLRSVVLLISEARDHGDGGRSNRFHFYDHMKTYTASPPETMRINEKYLRQYTIFNRTGVIYTTNKKTDGIYLPPDDRRHYATWSERAKEDERFRGDYWPKMQHTSRPTATGTSRLT
jgi:hypothetical protein